MSNEFSVRLYICTLFFLCLFMAVGFGTFGYAFLVKDQPFMAEQLQMLETGMNVNQFALYAYFVSFAA